MQAKWFAPVVVIALALAGCRDVDSPSQPVAPADSPAAAVAGGHAIDEATIVPIAADVLAAAEWTRKDCALNSIDGKDTDYQLEATAPHEFKGFLIDNTDAAAGAFSFVLKGDTSYEIPASTGAPRPDVAEYFKNPALATAGFDFTTTLGKVPAGNYKAVLLVRRGEHNFFCETGKDIVVQGGAAASRGR